MKKTEKSKYTVALTFENGNGNTTAVHIVEVIEPSEDEKINQKMATSEALKRDTSIESIKSGARLIGHAALYIEPW